MSGSSLRQHLVTITANLAFGFPFGIILGWTSPSLPVLSSSETPLDEPLSNDAASWVVAVMSLGGLFGSLLFGYISQQMGRKSTGYLIGILYLVQWLSIIFASSAWHLYIARIVGGIAMGGASTIVPLFVVEIAEVRIRGRLGSFFMFSQIIGVLFVYVVGDNVTYDVLSYICLALPLIFSIGFLACPETPTFLMKNNEEKKAADSLRWYRGIDHDSTDESFINELELLKMSSLKTTDQLVLQDKVTMKDLFQVVNLRGLIIGMILVVIMQMTGVGAIVSYAESIFSKARGTLSPGNSSAIIATIRVLGSCVVTLLVESLGRKILLTSSSIGIAVAHISLGAYLYAQHLGADVTSFSWLPVTALSVFLFFVASGTGTVPLVVISEIFSPKMRGISSSLCMSLLWILHFVVLKTFSSMEITMGLYGTLWFYGVVSIFGFIFIVFCVPETKGRPIEDILKELGSKNKEICETYIKYKE